MAWVTIPTNRDVRPTPIMPTGWAISGCCWTWKLPQATICSRSDLISVLVREPSCAGAHSFITVPAEPKPITKVIWHVMNQCRRRAALSKKRRAGNNFRVGHRTVQFPFPGTIIIIPLRTIIYCYRNIFGIYYLLPSFFLFTSTNGFTGFRASNTINYLAANEDKYLKFSVALRTTCKCISIMRDSDSIG